MTELTNLNLGEIEETLKIGDILRFTFPSLNWSTDVAVDSGLKIFMKEHARKGAAELEYYFRKIRHPPMLTHPFKYVYLLREMQ